MVKVKARRKSGFPLPGQDVLNTVNVKPKKGSKSKVLRRFNIHGQLNKSKGSKSIKVAPNMIEAI